MIIMTAEQFQAITGHKPEFDDLERANCSLAGRIGHQSCGICRHGKPVFLCHECFEEAINSVPLDVH